MSTTVTTTTTFQSECTPISLRVNIGDDLKILRQNLRGLQVSGVRAGSDLQKFIPEGSLGTVLTQKEVGVVLQYSGRTVNPLLAKNIFHNCQKLLGILVYIDQETIIFDGFLDRGIADENLPLKIEDLKHLGNEKIENDFHATQYIFLAPTNILTESPDTKLFDKNYILPFYDNEALPNGEGGFGKVYKMKIYKDHQGGTSRDVFFARKEFRRDRSKKDGSFKTEKEAFEVLHKLKHKNIVQLLAAYIHDEVCNMILPLADHDLHYHLNNTEPPKSKSERRHLFGQFLGIAEALSCIHKLELEGTEMLGYHHDLKPQNILFSKGRFLISDFGLAHFKVRTEGSQTTWKAGTQSYGPPGAGPGTKVGRTYDIWSFGCILSEVLTFAVFGKEGVAEFKKQREISTSSYTDDCFHDGKKIKEKVLEWFDKLRGEFCSIELQTLGYDLIQLVIRTLAAKPNDRPLSEEVAKSFREALSPNPSPRPPPDMQHPIPGPHPNGYAPYSQETYHGRPQQPLPFSYPPGQSQAPPLNHRYEALQSIHHPNTPHIASHPYYREDQSQMAPGGYTQPSGLASPMDPSGRQHYGSPSPQPYNVYQHPSLNPPNPPYQPGNYPQTGYNSLSPTPHPQAPYSQQPYGPPQNFQEPYGQHYYSPQPPQNSHSPYPQPAYLPQQNHDPRYSPNPQNAYAPPTNGSLYSLDLSNTYTQSNHDPICQSCEEFAERCPYHGFGSRYTPIPGCRGCEMLKDRCTTHGSRG